MKKHKTIRKILQLFIATILLTSSFSLLSAPPLYTITDLGTMNATESIGVVVNDRGQVAGILSPVDGVRRAFVTDTEGNMFDLGVSAEAINIKDINNSGQVVAFSFNIDGTNRRAFVSNTEGNVIDLGSPDSNTVAQSINNNGQIAGTSDSHAFITDSDNNLIDLGTLGGTTSIGRAINASGQVAGDSLTVDGIYHTFVTDIEGNMFDLGKLGGTTGSSTGRAINDNGEVTGESNGHAFITTHDGIMIDLGTLGGDSSYGMAINNSGQVAGLSQTAGGERHAFVTDAEGNMFDLGSLNGDRSWSYAINDCGQVVGYYSSVTDPQHRSYGFVTDAEANMYSLNEVIINLPSDWEYLGSALDISNTGYITGRGITISGESRAYLLTPVDTTPPVLTVPEDMIVEATAILTPVDIGTATASATADCHPEIIISNDEPVDGFILGITEVVWTATDVADNVATDTQFITVQDTTPPVLTIPEDVTIMGNRTLNIVDFGSATATDIFEPVSIINDAPVDGFPRKSTTAVTWTATDANGNTATAVQLVIMTNKKSD